MKEATLLLAFTVGWVCADAPGGFNVGLGWDRSPDVDVVGYNLYYGSTIETMRLNKISVGNTNRQIIAGLPLGQEFYFAVTAVNSAGRESEPSNILKLPVWPEIAIQAAWHEQPLMIFSQVVANAVFVVEWAPEITGPWLPLGLDDAPGVGTVQDNFRGDINIKRFYRAKLEPKS